MTKHVSFFLLFFAMLCSFQSKAQLDDGQAQKIDRLFRLWNEPNHPGGAIAIAKDGKTVFSRAYGLASLEYLVPNAPGTIFNTGSVSKQFTAMGIVRLEEQGKLSFDDDIHTYVPELPNFGETITIRQMLHHTSGLRSLHALFALAGWRRDDSRTNADLDRIILNQKGLNFKPGSEYLYCNTGYMLMANIIENITNEPFKDWMKQHIFDELDMPQTYVEDLYSRVVPNNATSYYGKGNFERAVEYWGYVGSGNMHATTADLLKWLSNFHAPKKGWESSFQKMQTLDPFNDGSKNNYAFGVILDQHLGRKRIKHGGSIGGFRAYIASYPGEKLDIAVLTNFSSGNPAGNADKIAAIIFGDSKSEGTPNAEIQSVKLTNDKLRDFEGTYWNDREKYARKIYLKNDTLRYSRSEIDETPIIPVKRNAFKMYDVGADVSVVFDSKKNGEQMMVSVGEESPSIFDMVKFVEVDNEALKEYVGAYYSTEVETAYTISVKDGEIEMYHPRHGSIPLKVLFLDTLSGDWPIGTVQIKRNPKGEVSGILISNGRVRNAWFEKQ
ncbi:MULTISPECIES: serine hydrolase [Flavobacteriaceae]|uniref:serine hydrolase domain-containing protein n=1 Tax=Flavobacteriaceae TaxID=49546 RepID=UPI001492588D|nr:MULTISPECIES: serine hydrolase domain-containing protein [Allomuricauda]MDC6365569.1 serine hydrolase [Muricauda sp. AC10]